MKKYLYVLRPLLACEWLKKHHSAPPIEISTLIEDSESIPRKAIQDLIESKMAGFEATEGPKIDVLNKYIEDKLTIFSELVRTMPKVKVVYDDLDEVFFYLVWQEKFVEAVSGGEYE